MTRPYTANKNAARQKVRRLIRLIEEHGAAEADRIEEGGILGRLRAVLRDLRHGAVLSAASPKKHPTMPRSVRLQAVRFKVEHPDMSNNAAYARATREANFPLENPTGGRVSEDMTLLYKHFGIEYAPDRIALLRAMPWPVVEAVANEVLP